MVSIEKQGDSTKLALLIDVSKLDINKNHLLLLTPVIASSDGKERVSLEPIAVIGKQRNKILNRPVRSSKKNRLFLPENYRVVRKNYTKQKIDYTTVTPYEEWQRSARLIMETTVIGCAECGENLQEISLSEKILPDPFVPSYRASYIAPEVEKVKQRSKSYTANLNYMAGKWDLIPSFKDNRRELDKVGKIVTELKGNDDFTITGFTIIGYASPEGSFEMNLLLSRRRAESFANYLEKYYGFGNSRFKVEWQGEDWTGLRAAVEQSYLPNKAAIIEIIDNINPPDARDAKLRALDNGFTYNRLLAEFYPTLRRNEYRISYVIRPFNIDEAAEIIKRDPSLLSLNEMYMAASKYPVNSPEYREAIAIAAATYPESVTAKLNAALNDINKSDYNAALRQLLEMENYTDAWNLLGIAYACKGNLEKAKSYFTRAADAGRDDADYNLEQLQQYINDNQ